MTVLGYFGPAGTFTHQAMLSITDADGVAFSSVGEALDAVQAAESYTTTLLTVGNGLLVAVKN